jgi:hypothetical protein
MAELEALGNERHRLRYLGQGVREPVFGVTIGSMKPLLKRVGLNQELADQLFATGNFDAMYFAGMIAEPTKMTEADFERWMDGAYCAMVGEWIVSVTLAEADCAIPVANRWIDSTEEFRAAAGWACYEWLLGWRPDSYFDQAAIESLLERVVTTIHTQPDRVRYTMNNFVIAAALSYIPTHEPANAAAQAIGEVHIAAAKGTCALPLASVAIQKAIDKGRLGFKRRAVRC